MEMYKKAYEPIVFPINGPDMWPPCDFDPIHAPVKQKLPGRPKKARRKDPTEFEGESRKGDSTSTEEMVRYSVKCTICNDYGHNRRTCPRRTGPEGGHSAQSAAPTTNVAEDEGVMAGNDELIMSQVIDADGPSDSGLPLEYMLMDVAVGEDLQCNSTDINTVTVDVINAQAGISPRSCSDEPDGSGSNIIGGANNASNMARTSINIGGGENQRGSSGNGFKCRSRSRKIPNPQRTVRCRACLEKGHDVRTCTTKQGAYMRSLRDKNPWTQVVANYNAHLLQVGPDSYMREERHNPDRIMISREALLKHVEEQLPGRASESAVNDL